MLKSVKKFAFSNSNMNSCWNKYLKILGGIKLNIRIFERSKSWVFSLKNYLL